MPRRAKGITAAKVAKGRAGRYCDGDGLWLTVRSRAAKFWTFKYVRAGVLVEMGLGPAAGRKAVTLTDARAKARELWDQHKEGRDPLAEKRARRRTLARPDAAKGVRTFRQAALEHIEAHRSSWNNPISFKQWMQSLTDYAFPLLGDMAVDAINTDHVVAVLMPIWNSKTQTASRVRSRIEQILNREKALKHRSGDNPAAWVANLDAVLPASDKVARVRHHEAMPYAEIGDFMAKLRVALVGADGKPDIINHALEFCILTCARTDDVLGANWGEIDLDQKLWIIPAERMKAEREHRVALSDRAVEIVKAMQAIKGSEFVFPGIRAGAGLSKGVLLNRLRKFGFKHETVHGFRSTFKDWAAERTNIANEVSEMALAHAIPSIVEAAYRRGDLLAKRFDLAEKWSEFCEQPPITDGSNVVPMRGSAQ